MKDDPTPTDPAEALFEELAAEADAGFPRLRRIPATGVVQFLDYFQAQDPRGRNRLLSELAVVAVFFLERRGERPPSPSLERMRQVLTAPGPFVGGWRYTDVRFLAQVDRMEELGPRQRWLQSFAPQALQPRFDLLPDPEAMVPAKAALLRKLVKAAMLQGGYAASSFGGGLRFLSPEGTLVACDFGSRMGQLRWQVAFGASRPTHGLVEMPWFSYEGLWMLRSDWDCLTEENAERCIAGLPGLVDDVRRIVGGRAAPASRATASP